jgi:hypothetical protein
MREKQWQSHLYCVRTICAHIAAKLAILLRRSTIIETPCISLLLKFLIYCLFLHTHVVWWSFYSNRRNTGVSMIKKILCFLRLHVLAARCKRYMVSLYFSTDLRPSICERWASKCSTHASTHLYVKGERPSVDFKSASWYGSIDIHINYSTILVHICYDLIKNHIFAENEV